MFKATDTQGTLLKTQVNDYLLTWLEAFMIDRDDRGLFIMIDHDFELCIQCHKPPSMDISSINKEISISHKNKSCLYNLVHFIKSLRWPGGLDLLHNMFQVGELTGMSYWFQEGKNEEEFTGVTRCANCSLIDIFLPIRWT